MGEVMSEEMSEANSEVKSDKMSESALNALKIAFTYMPKSIEVTKYEYGDSYQKILDHIETVREILLINDVDPEEVYGEVNPESTPNSTY
jgi:hypothetical protein